MLHSRTITKLLRSEEGRSLPFALVVVAVGALLVSPFLAYVSTSLLGSRAMQEGMNKQYSSDAGVEFGIWKLVNDSAFRSQVDATPGTPVATGPITVNQFTTTITVTALSAGGWITLTNAPANVGAGGALVYTGGDHIYALRGNNQRNFWQYSISGDSWTSSSNAPRVGGGGALAYTGGDYVYALRGNGTRAFRRYRISNNSWAGRRSTPAAVGYGGALAYTGDDYIYAFRGGNTDDFWRYCISWDWWNCWFWDPADPGVTIGPGGALAYDGGDYIYAFRGNNSNLFGRYYIPGNSWEVRDTAPANVGGGGALVYTGGDYIYALQGNGSMAFWRYSISQDQWDDTLPPVPDPVGDGGALAYDGTYIYAFRGGNTNVFWRFSPGPSTYDIMATAGGVSIEARVAITGTDEVVIQLWEMQ